MRAKTTALLVVLAAACTPHPIGPARTFGKYEGKAVTTAESALSAVETVRLAAEAASGGRAFGPYVSVLISEQEETLDGLQGTFRSIQPPSEQADDLRRELDGMLGDALDHVIDVRVAARRGELATLAEVATPLESDAAALEQFTDEHSS